MPYEVRWVGQAQSRKDGPMRRTFSRGAWMPVNEEEHRYFSRFVKPFGVSPWEVREVDVVARPNPRSIPLPIEVIEESVPIEVIEESVPAKTKKRQKAKVKKGKTKRVAEAIPSAIEGEAEEEGFVGIDDLDLDLGSIK